MDNSSSTLSDDDRSDSWSIIDENVPEDGIDFEIVKDLFDNNVEQESNSSEIGDVEDENVIPTVTTFPNKENQEENHLTTTPNNEENTNVVIDFTPSTSSLRQRHIVKEKVPEFDVEKNDPKEKCTKRKRRFYKCPFIAGVSLGTILTVCGLSLILKSSDEIISCPENKNVSALNLDNTLASALEDHALWPSILEEDKLIRKYCPNKYNRDYLKNKNMRTKLLKRIDRRIKQQIRGCDLKALKNKTDKQKQKNDFIGPLSKECCIQRNDENKSNSKSNFSKQKPFNDAFIFQAMCPVKTSQTNCITTSIDKIEPCKENNLDSKLNQNKALFVQPKPEQNEKLVDKPIIPTIDNKNNKVSKDFTEQEKSYNQLKHNIIEHNCKALQDENNKQADIVTSLENRINTIRHENLRLCNIIREQENLLDCIQSKLRYKKKLFEKRDLIQQNLEKHLKLVQDRKILTAKRSIAAEDDRIVSALSTKMSDKLLDEMLLITIKNSKTKNESDRGKEYILGNYLEPKNYGSIEKKNEYKPNIPLMKCRDVEKKPKENLNIFLERQKLIAEKARKMGDEEHKKQNNQFEKCDPQKSWIRKRN